MRNAGLPIEALIEYVDLFQRGDETIDARKELLTEKSKILIEKNDEKHYLYTYNVLISINW